MVYRASGEEARFIGFGLMAVQVPRVSWRGECPILSTTVVQSLVESVLLHGPWS